MSFQKKKKLRVCDGDIRSGCVFPLFTDSQVNAELHPLSPSQHAEDDTVTTQMRGGHRCHLSAAHIVR